MPPDRKLQTESREQRIARLAQEEVTEATRHMLTTPSQRSEVEKVAAPTLAERMFPGRPQAQQGVRQVADTVSSAAGGYLGGGLNGALLGAMGSMGAGMVDSSQAQEIGSASNLANIMAPGIGGAARLFPGSRQALNRFPGIMNGLLSGTETGTQAGARALDTGESVPAAVGGGALVGGGLGAITGKLHSEGQDLTARQSPDVRSALSKMAGVLPEGIDPQKHIEDFRNQMSRLSPYIDTPAQAATKAAERAGTLANLAAESALLPKLKATAKAAGTNLTKAEKQANFDKITLENAVEIERAKSADFIKMYPDESKRLDAEIEQLSNTRQRGATQFGSPQQQTTFDDLVNRRQQLRTEHEVALEDLSSENKLKQKALMAREKSLTDWEKPVRDASQAESTASSAFKAGVSRVRELSAVARSYATNDAAKTKALDNLAAAGIRDPRQFTDDARQAMRELLDDPKFSPQSFFENTIEARKGSEVMSKGLMDAIGNDSATKTAVRQRYVQHVFQKFQQGAEDNVYGQTIKAKEFINYVGKLDERAFNNFMESGDAYKNLTALSDRLRKSVEREGNHMLGLSIGVGVGGMAGYIGAHAVGGGQGEDTGGLMLKMAVGGAMAGAVGRILSWRSISNNILQAKGQRAQYLRSFLESDNPEKLPNAVLKGAISLLFTHSTPVKEPSAEAKQ